MKSSFASKDMKQKLVRIETGNIKSRISTEELDSKINKDTEDMNIIIDTFNL